MIDLAVTPGVVYSVQSVAQNVLKAGWILLLPTADERARALSLLLPANQNLPGNHKLKIYNFIFEGRLSQVEIKRL